MIVTANRIPVPLPIAPVQEERGQSIQGSHYYSRDNSTWLQEHTHTHTGLHLFSQGLSDVRDALVQCDETVVVEDLSKFITALISCTEGNQAMLCGNCRL